MSCVRMRNRHLHHPWAFALLWMLILLLTAQGCASAYRTLADPGDITDNPRDYFDPGDRARLTLGDGRQIDGEVTQLRSDSITLDETTVPWSDVVVAEMDQREKSDVVTAAWITIPVVAVVGVFLILANSDLNLD